MFGEDSQVYGEWMSLLTYYQQFGWLMRQGLIDLETVGEMESGNVIHLYERMMPDLEEWVSRTGRRQKYDHFDYLYSEMKKWRETNRPEYSI
jgi:hypothetical protein